MQLDYIVVKLDTNYHTIEGVLYLEGTFFD